MVEEPPLRVHHQEAAVLGEERLAEELGRPREEHLLVLRPGGRLGHRRDHPLLLEAATQALLDALEVGHVHEGPAQAAQPPLRVEPALAAGLEPTHRAVGPDDPGLHPVHLSGPRHRVGHRGLEGRPVVRVDELDDVGQAGVAGDRGPRGAEEAPRLVRPPHGPALGVHLPDGHPRGLEGQGEALLAARRPVQGVAAGQAAQAAPEAHAFTARKRTRTTAPPSAWFSAETSPPWS